MGSLTGKVAVVTGSSRGLGLAIARRYASEGAAVVISSRTGAAVDQAVANLQKEGCQAAGMAGDTSRAEDVEALARLALDTFGRLDIWVNNAGSGAPYGPTLAVPPERFEQVLRTNIFGVYHGSRTAMSIFVPQKSGKLINLVGRGEKNPVPLQNAYGSSKTWVRAFTRTLAKEYRDSGVGVYCFNPGLVITEMLTHMEAIEGYAEKARPLETVMRLWAQTPDIPAERALWLASSATDGKTGLEVNVLDTGLLVRGLLRDVWGRITGNTREMEKLNIRQVPAAVPVKK